MNIRGVRFACCQNYSNMYRIERSDTFSLSCVNFQDKHLLPIHTMNTAISLGLSWSICTFCDPTVLVRWCFDSDGYDLCHVYCHVNQ